MGLQPRGARHGLRSREGPTIDQQLAREAERSSFASGTLMLVRDAVEIGNVRKADDATNDLAAGKSHGITPDSAQAVDDSGFAELGVTLGQCIE